MRSWRLLTVLCFAVPAAAQTVGEEPAREAAAYRDAAGGVPAQAVPQRPPEPRAQRPRWPGRSAEQRAFWRNMFWVAVGASAAIIAMRLGSRRH